MSTDRSGGGNERENNEDEEEQRRRWREIYGDMIPERIVDTRIGEDGKRYYKVQWAASMFEPAKNFLEAEHLIRKYWDPVEKKLKLPNARGDDKNQEEEQGASTSTTSQNNTAVESPQTEVNDQDNTSSEETKEVDPSLVHTPDIKNTAETVTERQTDISEASNSEESKNDNEPNHTETIVEKTQGEVSRPREVSRPHEISGESSRLGKRKVSSGGDKNEERNDCIIDSKKSKQES